MSTEDNILIAKFMGYEVVDYQHNQYKPIYNGNKYAKTIGEQKTLWGGLDLQFTGRFTECVNYPFNSDWNYLMPIISMIENIENARFNVEINQYNCRIYDTENFEDLHDQGGETKILSTYCACVEFIKWHNQQLQDAENDKLIERGRKASE